MHQILSGYTEARTDEEKEAKPDKQVITTQRTGRQGSRVFPVHAASMRDKSVKIFGWHPEEPERGGQAASRSLLCLKCWKVIFAGKVKSGTGLSHSKITQMGNVGSKTVNPTFIKHQKKKALVYLFVPHLV